MKIKSVWKIIVSIIFMAILSAFNATAADLIVVATKATQDASKDWLGFLESKEIPVKVVTPDSFSGVKEELYIFVLGSLDESKEIADIAREALTADEYKAITEGSSAGKMFYKPQAWNVGQKVILIIGPNQEAVTTVRKAEKEKWFEMLKEWFDVDDTESFHVY
jgi:hypothetical protein